VQDPGTGYNQMGHDGGKHAQLIPATAAMGAPHGTSNYSTGDPKEGTETPAQQKTLLGISQMENGQALYLLRVFLNRTTC